MTINATAIKIINLNQFHVFHIQSLIDNQLIPNKLMDFCHLHAYHCGGYVWYNVSFFFFFFFCFGVKLAIVVLVHLHIKLVVYVIILHCNQRHHLDKQSKYLCLIEWKYCHSLLYHKLVTKNLTIKYMPFIILWSSLSAKNEWMQMLYYPF